MCATFHVLALLSYTVSWEVLLLDCSTSPRAVSIITCVCVCSECHHVCVCVCVQWVSPRVCVCVCVCHPLLPWHRCCEEVMWLSSRRICSSGTDQLVRPPPHTHTHIHTTHTHAHYTHTHTPHTQSLVSREMCRWTKAKKRGEVKRTVNVLNTLTSHTPSEDTSQTDTIISNTSKTLWHHFIHCLLFVCKFLFVSKQCPLWLGQNRCWVACACCHSVSAPPSLQESAGISTTIIMILWKLRERPFIKIKSQNSILGLFWTKAYSPWSIQKMGNYGPFQIWDLSIPSERVPSKLSQRFGPSEL